MAWTNSPMVSYTLISPNKYIGRRDYYGNAITTLERVAVHCVVGQVTVERLGQIFANPSRYASSNYGVGLDGKIGMYVEEKDTSWCTSSSVDTKYQHGCDNHGISIEVASDAYYPYATTSAAYEGTIKLVADICKRNGKKKLTWISDKAKNLAYTPAKDELLLTAHRFYSANRSCPGDYLFNKFPDLTRRVNDILAQEEIPWGVDDYVGGLYKYALTREPDTNGYNNWCHRLMSGQQTASQVAWGFFGSKEYVKKNTTDSRYVQQLYQALLRREPDKDGKATWLKKLKSGKTRQQVCNGITSSKEFKDVFCKKRKLTP